jgi:hypothetical protein
MDYQAHLYRHFWRSGALAERRPETCLAVGKSPRWFVLNSGDPWSPLKLRQG